MLKLLIIPIKLEKQCQILIKYAKNMIIYAEAMLRTIAQKLLFLQFYYDFMILRLRVHCLG